MDIKILDSHLREHLQTNATAQEIAKAFSLTSASIEKVEPFGKDFIYSVEVTTNRVDMLSVRGLAKEGATILPQFGFNAKLLPLTFKKPVIPTKGKESIYIKNDDKLVRRICAVIMEVEKKESPEYIKKRLEAAGIRSLNNLIDTTNYVMLEMGHPSHVFDYDRLSTKKLIIRPSRKGEKIITLDKREHTLAGDDIVADNSEGEIVDLLGVMGTANSVVTDSTKRILFFLDNNYPWRIRKTSMGLAIRTQAAAINEKGVDPELAMDALLRGISLYQKVANAKVVSDIIDIYPGKSKPTTVTVNNEKISTKIGVSISIQKSLSILKSLGFLVKKQGKLLVVTIPSFRDKDITIEEDIIEEIARIYGYHNIPAKLPTFEHSAYYHQDTDEFYWEKKIKDALKFWGFTEVYTYSMVSSEMLIDPIENVITLKNPLDEEHVYMRSYLIPSFKTVINENKWKENMFIFELANVYKKQEKGLPKEIRTLAILMKGKIENQSISYFHVKGIIEQLAQECNISSLVFKEYLKDKTGAYIYIGKEEIGQIIIFDHDNLGITAEINFDKLISFANAKKTYVPLPKYPPVLEDLALIIDSSVKTGDIVKEIQKQSPLIREVFLLDQFNDTRTFHVMYQNPEKNLTTDEVGKIREKILHILTTKFSAKIK